MRRAIVALFAMLLFCAERSYAQPRIRCLVAGATFSSLRQRSEGVGVIPGIDGFIGAEAVALGQIFGVTPEFAYLPGIDQDADNAFASPEHEDRLASGSVFFGRRLLAGVLQDEHRGYASLAGILAHEFGHIAQFRRNEPLDELESELQADYLAGYYLARRSHTLPDGPEQFVYTLFGYGDEDFDFYHPVGHGTGDQRVAAMLAGVYDNDRSFNNAFRNGLQRVRQLIPTFVGRGSGYAELSQEAHDPEAYSQLQLTLNTVTWNLNPADPFANFRYQYVNNGSDAIVVKLIVNSLILPVDEQGNDTTPRILTQRRMQQLVQPGQKVEFRDRIRSTSQSQIVRVRISEDVVVAFASKLNQDGTPVTPPTAAPSSGATTGSSLMEVGASRNRQQR